MCLGHTLASVIEVRDFTVDITDAQIKDLRERLTRARLPEAETVDDWSQGIPLAYLRELSDYWARDYDMGRLAGRLNALPQFHATIDELGVHFLHIRSPHRHARPLIMTHGWPGSVLEFVSLVGPLTDPPAHGGAAEDAFHLVIPALPGFGFSDKPSRPGTGTARIATAWHQLMTHLGYPEYYAQGGDLGAAVTAAMATQHPEGLLGIHVNMALASLPALQALGESTPEEQAMLAKVKRYWDHESGYSTQQKTRPQTLGYGLADSPTGQLAWIVEVPGLDRLQRPPGERGIPRRDAGQRDALLAQQHRDIVRPAVLGELSKPRDRQRHRAQRVLAVPPRTVRGERALAANAVHRPALLPPDRARRPFRGTRAARHLRTRSPKRYPRAAVITATRPLGSARPAHPAGPCTGRRF